MPQKTIWLPDDLDAGLKALAEKINVSQVAQDALRKEMNRLEASTIAEDDLPALIERLKREKVEYQEKWRNRGKLLALQWARSAPYEELIGYVNKVINTERFDPALFVIGPDFGEYPIWVDAVSAASKKYSVIKELAYEDEDNYVQVTRCRDSSFTDGWLEGINSFWDQVKDVL